MTKVLIQGLERHYTKVAIQDMDRHLDVHMETASCVALADRFPLTTVEIETDSIPDDYIEAGSLIIVSGRLKVVMEEMGVHAEFIRLRMTRDGKEYTNQEFYFCNILDCVDCFDYKRGVFKFCSKPGFTSEIDSVERLAIDEAKAASHVLFRLGNGLEYIICVSDALAERLKASGYVGMKLVEPEDWFFGCY